VENLGGNLKLKRLDLTWSGQVDLTAATPRSTDNLQPGTLVTNKTVTFVRPKTATN